MENKFIYPKERTVIFERSVAPFINTEGKPECSSSNMATTEEFAKHIARVLQENKKANTVVIDSYPFKEE